MVDALLEEVNKWEEEESAKGTLKREKHVEMDNGRVRLPMLS